MTQVVLWLFKQEDIESVLAVAQGELCLDEALASLALAVNWNISLGDDDVRFNTGFRACADIELIGIQSVIHCLEDFVLELRFGLAVLEAVKIALDDGGMRGIHGAGVLARRVLVVDLGTVDE